MKRRDPDEQDEEPNYPQQNSKKAQAKNKKQTNNQIWQEKKGNTNQPLQNPLSQQKNQRSKAHPSDAFPKALPELYRGKITEPSSQPGLNSNSHFTKPEKNLGSNKYPVHKKVENPIETIDQSGSKATQDSANMDNLEESMNVTLLDIDVICQDDCDDNISLSCFLPTDDIEHAQSNQRWIEAQQDSIPFNTNGNSPQQNLRGNLQFGKIDSDMTSFGRSPNKINEKIDSPKKHVEIILSELTKKEVFEKTNNQQKTQKNEKNSLEYIAQIETPPTSNHIQEKVNLDQFPENPLHMKERTSDHIPNTDFLRKNKEKPDKPVPTYKETLKNSDFAKKAPEQKNQTPVEAPQKEPPESESQNNRALNLEDLVKITQNKVPAHKIRELNDYFLNVLEIGAIFPFNASPSTVLNLKSNASKNFSYIFNSIANRDPTHTLELNSKTLNIKIVSSTFRRGDKLDKKFLDKNLNCDFIEKAFQSSKTDFPCKLEYFQYLFVHLLWDDQAFLDFRDVVDILQTLLVNGILAQFSCFLTTTDVFTQYYAKLLFCAFYSHRQEDIYDRIDCFANYVMILMLFHQIMRPIFSMERKLISELEIVLFLTLFREFYSDFLNKYSRLTEIKKDDENIKTILKVKDLLEVVNQFLLVHGHIQFDVKLARSEFEKFLVQNGENNFRSASLFLKSAEVFSNQPSQLRPIYVNKPYPSVETYLDINFRLLKEDCFRSLAAGLRTYEETETRNDRNDFIHVNECRVLHIIMDDRFAGLEAEIAFKKRPANPQNFLKKHFTEGNLVILSTTKFRSFSTFICKKKGEDFVERNGKIGLRIFIELADPNDNLYQAFKQLKNTPVLMTESPAFFEAYYHILNHMQKLKSFPLSEVIVFCKTELNHQPNYLQNFGYGEIAPKFEKGFHNQSVTKFVDSWLREKKVMVDKSQKEAIHLAFSTRLTLIQGPPGTGKTYVGKNIVRLFLEKKIKSLTGGPIVIICYTNHALDQFLELISEFTQSITRFGNRSKCEALQQFLLKNKRQSPDFRKFKKPGSAVYFQRRENEIKNFQNLQFRFKLLSEFDFLSSEEIITNEIYEDFFQVIKRVYLTQKTIFQKSLKMKKVNESDLKKIQEIFKYLEENFSVFAIAILNWLKIFTFDFMFKFLTKAPEPTNNNMQKNKKGKKVENTKELKDDFDLYEREKDKRGEFYEDITDEKYSKEQINKKFKFFLNNNYSQIAEYFKLDVEKKNNKLALTFSEAKKFHDQFFINFLEAENADKLEYFDTCFYNPLKMKDRDRWLLHFYLCENLKLEMEKSIQEKTEIIKYCGENLERFDNEAVLKMIATDDVIGMTTTGAVKFKSILARLQSRVVVIEEAAEVIESHIITSLTANTQHLILIGDHMQLRPGINNIEIKQVYHLDVSLFERMINNGFKNIRLKIQRRMRPEVSVLVNLFYGDIVDDESVRNRPGILNLRHNVFFFNHDWLENESDDSSKVNEQEGEFILAFCSCLIASGYKPTQMVILSLYAGQLLSIQKKKMNIPALRFVNIKTVDDYQGEECDIILLSLVRSNKQGNIGFLKVDNRVNVALSRARLGMFLFGNAECIRSHIVNQYARDGVNTLWRKVLTYMTEKQLVVNEIEFYCRHHQSSLFAKDKRDFTRIPRGGCDKICKARLECGHPCEYYCHPINVSPLSPDGHIGSEYLCKANCHRNHGCAHKCLVSCVKCNADKECKVLVSFTRPTCLHIFNVECFRTRKEKEIACVMDCPLSLGCGHKCAKKCSESCTELLYCNKPCRKNMACGHLCSHKCKDRCQNSTTCKEIIEHIFPKCGHSKKFECGLVQSKSPLVICDQKCVLIMKCGHNCTKDCKAECLMSWECKQEVTLTHVVCNHSNKMECGKVTHATLNTCPSKCARILDCTHPCNQLCAEKCERKYCKAPCERQLTCGHACKSVCGNKCALTACKEPCQRKLPCGHPCKATCGEACKQGNCKAACPRVLSCGHECTNFCGENCRLSDCKKPCERLAPCGHPCKQLCNSPCKQVNCKVLVNFKHPLCGREFKVSCQLLETPQLIKCPFVCQKKAPCGHACLNICGTPCTPKNTCERQCNLALICGHMCPRTCKESCLPHTQCREILTYTHPLCGHKFPVSCGSLRSGKEITCPFPCEKLISCGHWCPKKCVEVCPKVPECQQKCNRKVNCGHACKKTCKEPCTQPKECKEVIKLVEPWCKHPLTYLCWEKNNPVATKCPAKCEKRLICGHACSRSCGDLCNYHNTCTEVCQKQMDCGHLCLQECNERCTKAGDCKQPCKKILKCGHQCKLGCFQNCEDKFCDEPCSVVLNCGHKCTKGCGQACSPDDLCVDSCCKKMECGHICPNNCNRPCLESAACQSPCTTRLKCGHLCHNKCSEVCSSVPECVEKCTRKLECGHLCDKTCKELCPAMSHCQAPCQKRLQCGHLCPKKCGELCSADFYCPQKCERKLKCGHGCSKTCGQDCNAFVLCNQACEKIRECGHKCRSVCYKQCSNGPKCLDKCAKKLPCGHQCTKLCSEPCSKPDECKEECLRTRKCGHKCADTCSENCVAKFCRMQCRKVYPCGSKCPSLCSWPCVHPKNCEKPCLKKMRCGHSCTQLCGRTCSSESTCAEPCAKYLSCGHKCQKRCSETCESWLVEPLHLFRTGCVYSQYNYKAYCKCTVHRNLQSDCKIKVMETAICGCTLERNCSHKSNLADHKLKCPELCNEIKKCGHPCQQKFYSCRSEASRYICSSKNAKTNAKPYCEIKITGTAVCGCNVEKNCSDQLVPMEHNNCLRLCNETKNCGHPCQQKFYSCRSAASGYVCSFKNAKINAKRHCEIKVTGTAVCGCNVEKNCSDASFLTYRHPDCLKLCLETKKCGHICQDGFYTCRSARSGFTCLFKEGTNVKSQCRERVIATEVCGCKVEKNCSDQLFPMEHSDCLRDCNETKICGHLCRMKFYSCRWAGSGYVCRSKNDKANCQQDCKKKLSCGHVCKRKCNQICEHPDRKNCEEQTLFTALCGHQRSLDCNESQIDFMRKSPCQAECGQQLACGHTCTNKCSDCKTLKVRNQKRRGAKQDLPEFELIDLRIHACECTFLKEYFDFQD